jgi:hypothetical protein
MAMGTKSRETIYGGSIQASAERAAEARKEADRLAYEAGTSACSASRDPPSPRQRWATRSIIYISKSNALATTPINGRAEHRAPAEGDTYPRIGALYALQGLLGGSWQPI